MLAHRWSLLTLSCLLLHVKACATDSGYAPWWSVGLVCRHKVCCHSSQPKHDLCSLLFSARAPQLDKV